MKTITHGGAIGMRVSSIPPRLQDQVIGVPVDVVTWDHALRKIFDWAQRRESRGVCFCNVHSAVTAANDRRHAEALSMADMVAADGAPIAWALRGHGHAQQRISGPDLMWACCELASKTKTSMYFFGSTEKTLELLTEKLRRHWPALQIAGAVSPPFRAISDEEDAMIVEAINNSGAGIVWVGLGCPKQESWIAQHRGRVHAVMLGVGAAFDFHAGVAKRAPLWMQKSGLEWVHRLSQDPRRLMRRYATTNTTFIISILRARSRKTTYFH